MHSPRAGLSWWSHLVAKGERVLVVEQPLHSVDTPLVRRHMKGCLAVSVSNQDGLFLQHAFLGGAIGRKQDVRVRVRYAFKGSW